MVLLFDDRLDAIEGDQRWIVGEADLLGGNVDLRVL